jgi:hypothetical protein
MRTARVSRTVLMVIGLLVALPQIALAQSDPKATAQAIDAIIYSDLTKEQMLERLKPLVAVMDSRADFESKTGLQLWGFGTGPGVMHYFVENCGLNLIVDPDQKIRIIRRTTKTVGGKQFSEMSISERGFSWKGYARWYPN